ncbi:hypothetical protein MRX96_029874 [Rhipicephalus microplus]
MQYKEEIKKYERLNDSGETLINKAEMGTPVVSVGPLGRDGVAIDYAIVLIKRQEFSSSTWTRASGPNYKARIDTGEVKLKDVRAINRSKQVCAMEADFFFGTKEFCRLQEALEELDNEEVADNDVDLVIVLPKPAAEADEGGGNDCIEDLGLNEVCECLFFFLFRPRVSDDTAEKILMRIAQGNSSNFDLSGSNDDTIVDPSFSAPP